MALGLHWEWRGFGSVSSRFSNLFGALEPAYASYVVEDLYVWLPRLEVNAKIRTGAEGGMKFKRLRDVDRDLEQWSENPDDVYPFPLSRKGWETLEGILAGVDVVLAPYASVPPDSGTVIDHLTKSGCTVVNVHKRREGRQWQGPNGKVIVELADISRPEQIISVGLESRECESDGQDVSDHQARDDLRAAIEHFGLQNESLRVLN